MSNCSSPHMKLSWPRCALYVCTCNAIDMMSKPSSCLGCPMYQNGQGFVPDEIVEGSQVFILGQNPGADEESEGKPVVGRTGEQMMGEFFPRAGLVQGENV